MSGKRSGPHSVTNKQQMIQYLYGELDEPARAHLEEQFFTDQEQFAALERVEDQLIDDYVSDALPAAERHKFETAYLISARRRQKLQFAQDLHQSLASTPRVAPKSFLPTFWANWQFPMLRYGLVAASVVFVLLGIWWVRSSFRAPTPVPEQAALTSVVPSPSVQITPVGETLSSSPSPSTAATGKPSPPPHKQPASATILLSVLSPGQFRDDTANEASNKIVIAPQVTNVTLKLKYDRNPEYSGYRAIIETVSGQKLMNLKPTAQGDFLTIQIPAKALATEDYVINLSGKNSRSEYEEINDYSFRVVKK